MMSEFATCKYCGHEMNGEHGCDGLVYFDRRGNKYEPIKVGDPGDLFDDLKPGDHCHDCNAPYGEPHHPGCDSESCPVCGGQMLMCDCITHLGKERMD